MAGLWMRAQVEILTEVAPLRTGFEESAAKNNL
jgi:hypothetical protein